MQMCLGNNTTQVHMDKMVNNNQKHDCKRQKRAQLIDHQYKMEKVSLSKGVTNQLSV